MSRRLLIAGLVALCALGLSALAASGASADTTAYTAGSPTAIPVGESTGLGLDALTTWELSTEQFGASIVLTGTAVDCENCMIENQENAGVMDVTGSIGGLLFTGVTTNIQNCTVEDPVKGAGTVTTEALKVTVQTPTSVVVTPVNGGTFATFHVVGPKCLIAGNYAIKGTSLTGTISGDAVFVNSTKELTVNKKPATLKGQATITVGLTGGTYHPIEFK